MKNNSITRRGILKTGAAAIAAPYIIPSSVLGKDAPSNKIAVGIIGAGSKGGGNMNQLIHHTESNIVAISDPNKKNLQSKGNKAKVPAERLYTDFRDLIARDDIDAVMISSPDHWHVFHAIMAIEAGKDVYGEKPMCNTMEEGQALIRTVNKHKAVFQHGTQLRSRIGGRRVCGLVRNGYIGDVKKIVIGSPPGRETGNHPPEEIPEWLDWNLWQGPAPEKPYTPWRCLRESNPDGLAPWYFISDYSKSGWVAGFGVHDMDLALWGWGMEDLGTVQIQGKGVFPKSGLFDTVLTFDLEFTFADGRKIIMTDTGKNKHGVTFHGEKDQWLFCRSGMDASDRDLLRIKLKDSDERIYQDELELHHKNWIKCIKTRQEPIAPVEAGHRATSLCLAGGICLQLGRKLEWDSGKQKFINDDEANSLLSYKPRAPWKL